MNSTGEWRDKHILTDDLQESFSSDIRSTLLAVRIQRSCALTLPLKCLETLKINYKVCVLEMIGNSRYHGPFQIFYRYIQVVYTNKS